MRVIAIIQARMGSTRLPGKVLMNILDRPMLWHVVQRTCRARLIDEVVVATTSGEADEAIVSLCRSQDWPYFRGSEEDVLDRYYQTARHYRADVVVRITSDCPLIDSGVIDRVIKAFINGQPELDYASNTLPPRTFPRGLDTEVFSLSALERAWREDTNPASREHVTPYIYRHPEKFRLQGVSSDIDYSYMRWTVDTLEDLNFVRKIFEHFGNNAFSWREVLRMLDEHPEWLEINRHVQQKVVP
ncbi:glycosyltransferase family protein [Desulfofundulus thermocisternus]|uniref:glycosyltransferase family protein n=1 Tax=Desulfofundulus thermocisternus TaxID=42471 RepID=UPI00217F10BF|nr:glycosyltransferase family protein [Desulfofundulus thermocisternus]MCS5696642.1 glycosyltransferase family protein [Desulfofundulus thermocisternus]